MLFLEGQEASLDRRVFSRLFPDELADVKLVPAGGVETVTRINSAVLQVVEQGLGWMNFYALRDRDYLTDSEVERYNSHPTGRLRVLRRCHIENYLLHDEVLAQVMSEIFDKTMDSDAVRTSLRSVAERISAEVLTKIVSFKLQRRTWPEDFSINEFPGVSIFLRDGGLNDGLIQSIQSKYEWNAASIQQQLERRLSSESVSKLVSDTVTQVREALSVDDDAKSWRWVFPGKNLLEGFAKANGVEAISLQNSVLSAMAQDRGSIPADLSGLMATVAAGSRFS